MSVLFQLFFAFIQVGLFSVGGGYAAIPLIQNQIVDIHKLMTLGEFTDLITIAEMTPGPISINSATFVGTRLAGIPGAVLCTLGCIIPSFIICLTLAHFYYKYRNFSGVQTVLSALRPAVVALIASAGLSILLLGLFMSDLSGIQGVKVDKHSTGGVGDKTTLIAAPMAAACGIPVAKMSGRGLGFTGGTVDKLESIPGYRTTLPKEEFFEIVNTIGISLIGQSGELAVADKKIYALRDVTATVDSLPLIASSIMSKKIASGADAILLDVKTGSGAFMKTREDSIALAQTMVGIGWQAGRRTAALITDMDTPLGNTAGNALEVIEALDTLKGEGPKDLTELCIHLAGNMLYLAGKGTLEECLEKAEQSIRDGSAYQKFYQMVQRQGGDVSYLEDTHKFTIAPAYPVPAPKDGFIAAMQTEEIGAVAGMLGAGREKKGDAVDFSAGIRFVKKTGDFVHEGEPVAWLYTNRENSVTESTRRYLDALTISDQAPEKVPLIQGRVSAKGIEVY